MDPIDAEGDPRQELAWLAGALRAHLEYARNAGTLGLPRSPLRPGRAAAPLTAPARPAPLGEDRAAPGPSPPGAPSPGAPSPGAPSPVASSPGASARPAAGAATPGPTAQDRQRLEVLAGEVSSCTRCGLHAHRTQTVFARGDGSSGICFVGEGPGADEDAQGYPFVGKAGQLLDRMIVAMGLGRDEVYVCNIVKCRPPQNRKPEPPEMAACRPYVVEQLALVKPQVIIALGATAVEGLLGIGGGITRLRGTWRLYQGSIPVMPTFHPAYLLRNPKAKRDVWNDLQEVLRHVGRPLPSRP